RWAAALIAVALVASAAAAQPARAALRTGTIRVVPNGIVMTRDHTTVLLEPYAANVIRVSISTLKAYALAPPGYGIIAKPDTAGWRYARTATGATYSSPRLSVTILGPPRHHSPHLLGQRRINQFFSDNGAPRYGNVRLRFRLADGRTVLRLEKWVMSRPSYGAGDRDILYDRRPSDPPFYR
ncbi:glycoside hydrolase family 31, partial [mine drainage metagenome]